MRDLASTYRAIEYIEARLQSDVTLAGMAQAAGYSLYHFIRAFNEDTCFTPYDYLMRRRLSQAACDLLESPARVLEIALAYRFNSHETFSRAFKRLFGLQPVQWRERGLIPHRVLAPALTLPFLEYIHQPGFQRPHRLELESRPLVGLMTTLEPASPASLASDLDARPRLWRSLEQFLPPLPEPMRRFSVVYHPEAGSPLYLAAAQIVSAPAAAPQAAALPLVRQDLPAGEYACMPLIGTAADLSWSLDYLHHIWLAKAGLRSALPVEIVEWEGSPGRDGVSLRQDGVSLRQDGVSLRQDGVSLRPIQVLLPIRSA